jgi:sugar phosphate isomerase/epimerase
MKLGAYTACLHDRSLPEALKILQELGLVSAEINAGGSFRHRTCRSSSAENLKAAGAAAGI